MHPHPLTRYRLVAYHAGMWSALLTELIYAIAWSAVYIVLFYLFLLYVLIPLKLWYVDGEPFWRAFTLPWKD